MKRDNITIIVADDHPFFRDGLIKVLELDRRFSVVDEAKDGEELIQKVKYFKPDISIVDITMPRKNGIEATREIKELGLASEVIALSMHTDEKFTEEVVSYFKPQYNL